MPYADLWIDTAHTGYRGQGSTPPPEFGTIALGFFQSKPVTPGGTITVAEHVSTQGATPTVPASGSNSADISAAAIFTKH